MKHADVDLSFKLKSRIGKSLYQIFGMCEEVQSFDKHHYQFKHYRYESSGNACRNLQAVLGERIRQKHSQSTKLVKEWEKEFFKIHLREPLSTDMDSDIMKQYMISTHARSVIKAWNL